MNERIKELIKSCGIIPEDEHYEVAELIVQECAEVAAKVGEGYVKMGYVVPLECSNKIKEHFGVE